MARHNARKSKQPTNKAIGYVRVSTDLQDCSLEVQETRITAYCVANNLDLQSILCDEDVSGKTLINERASGRLIANAVASGVCHVVALKLDRLFRNAKDALNTADEWQEKGVSLHLVDMGGQSINTGSTTGKLFFTMLAGFAEFERNTIADRITSALQHKKATGRVYNHVPFGFTRTDEKMLVENEGEQAVIVRMKSLRTTGESFSSIANTLNADSVPSKKGGVWHPFAVQKIVEAA